MPRLTFMTSVLIILFAFCISASDVWAKGGRGGSHRGSGFKGGGGSFNNGNNSRGKPVVREKQTRRPAIPTRDTSVRTRNMKPTSVRTEKGHRAIDNQQPVDNGSNLTADNAPWSRHQAREQRKLDHRRQVADHLREVSDRNGNDQLKQVADDMDQRAQSHYDQQMEKISQKYGADETNVAATEVVDAEVGDALAGQSGIDDSVLAEPVRKLTGRENALFRQLRNEQRKLANRMERVERMRQLAERAGDPDMLEAADRLEAWTMDHFDRRMGQITDFQQRHGLTDLSQSNSP